LRLRYRTHELETISPINRRVARLRHRRGGGGVTRGTGRRLRDRFGSFDVPADFAANNAKAVASVPE
jgi:hypothetical protein